MTISKRYQRFADMASIEAVKSPMLFQHGCVITKGKKVLFRGKNTLRNNSADGFIQDDCSCHAEVDALRRMYHSRVRKIGHAKVAKVF